MKEDSEKLSKGKNQRSVSIKYSTEMAEIYLENILAGSTENIYWMDLDGYVLGCNENQAKFLGYEKAADVIGKNVYDFAEKLGWGKKLADAIRANDLEVMRTRKPQKSEEVTVFDGKKRTFLSFKNPLVNKSGELIGVFGISVEITERKETEEKLQEEKERAERANRVKSDFLAVVSHELRIPLTAVLGMARLMEADQEEFLPEHQNALQDIIRSGEHLLTLVTDLLDLAKLEAGKLDIQPVSLNLRKLTEEVVTALNYQAKAKGLEILVDYETDVPLNILADPRALRQILINLLGNAIKFTNAGHIIVKISCVEYFQNQVTVLINVEDTGIGIAEDKYQEIFEKFNQADGSRTRQYGGTGLGLAITKYYVESMGGKISVQSQLGKGSIFSCLIPFQLENNHYEILPWGQYGAHVRVLIVDDTLRGEILYKHISSPLAQVVAGKEALNTLLSAQLRQEPFDIVIMDQQLITVNAMQLGSDILQQRSLQQPLLLLLTEKNSLPTQQQSKAAGFFTCIAKPVYPIEFLTHLTVAWEKWSENKNKSITKNQQVELGVQVLLLVSNYMMQRVYSIMFEKMNCQVQLAKNSKEVLEMVNGDYNIVFMDVDMPDLNIDQFINAVRQSQAASGKQLVPIIGLIDRVDEQNSQEYLQIGMDEVVSKLIRPKELLELMQRWSFGRNNDYYK